MHQIYLFEIYVHQIIMWWPRISDCELFDSIAVVRPNFKQLKQLTEQFLNLIMNLDSIYSNTNSLNIHQHK
jgi:hypothetical protein